jgi:hypothetical protein
VELPLKWRMGKGGGFGDLDHTMAAAAGLMGRAP